LFRNLPPGLQPIQLLDLVGGAEADDLAQLVAGLLRARSVALCHALPCVRR